MAQPKLSDEKKQEIVDEAARCGGILAASVKLGINRATADYRYRVAVASGFQPSINLAEKLEPTTNKDNLVEKLERQVTHLKNSLAEAVRPKFTIRQDNVSKTSSLRVVCIGDAHDEPGLDKSRFEWIGKYVRREKPDVVVQIGDFASLDSLSYWTPNGSLDGKDKPSFTDDLSSFAEALDALGCDSFEKHCTLGNHEHRMYRFEQGQPEVVGMLEQNFTSLLTRHKWTYSPFGMPTYYGGVAFVHVPLNRLGRAYGGKNSESSIANDSLSDIIIGHSHTDRRHRAPKIGTNKNLQVINVGCALPSNHVHSYAQHSTTGWSYGIADMLIRKGSVRDYNFVSMDSLKEKFK